MKPSSERSWRYESREVLLRNLHESIKYGGNDQSNGQNRLQSFNERMKQFLENCIEDRTQANSDLQELINWYEDPSHERERPDELLTRVFSRFVGFSLMK